MGDQANIKLDVQTKIKTESQDDEFVADEVDNRKKVKTEPLEEEASCSSIRITNSFSVSNGVLASGPSSTPNNSNNLNDSIASLTDSVDVVKTEPLEPVFMKTESGDKDEADSNAERNRAEIKTELGTDNTSSNSSQPLIPCNNIKTENTTNAVKKEKENSTVDQSIADTSTLSNYIPVVPPRDPSSAITNILTSSVPSTSVSRSPPNGAQANCVTSSTDGKPACRYGMRCYRLSTLHRVNFSHPPGSDPLKSPEKPRCKYGTRCYRKNEEHRKRFIHDRSPDNMMSNTRRRKVKNATSQTASVQYESDSDDSDYDGTSDEFHPDSSDDTDSDETDFEPDADDSLVAA